MASEPTADGSHDEVQTVTVRIFGNHEAAQLAAANLTAHGIECWVSADDCGGMYPNLTAASGVRLRASATDAKAAEALLDTPASPAEINQIETEAAVSVPSVITPPRKLAWVQIVLNVVVGVLLCLFYQWASWRGTITKYYYAADGKCDEAWIYHDGRLVEHLRDRNHDGIWDYWAFYEHGRVTRSESDDNFDGRPDVFWTYSDDGADILEKDTDFNGVPDEICRFKYRVIQQTDTKPNGSKFATTREVFTNGVLLEIWRGGDSNGNFNEVVRYDTFFNPVSTNILTAFHWLPPTPR